MWDNLIIEILKLYKNNNELELNYKPKIREKVKRLS